MFFMYVYLGSNQIMANICNFFMVRTFKIHSCGSFEICNVLLLIVVTLLYNRKPELFLLTITLCLSETISSYCELINF